MSYDNAEPKVLKTLNSSGQVLDDRGNVINDTSDFWTEKYNQAEPKADKILYSDGTVKDSAGNLIQDTTEYNVQKYNQAEPIPAKYLHSDGTINENPGGGGGADLDDNKAATIDVSTYTEPVEVTPTAGKDGMKKATVTLSNIPSGGQSLYIWGLDSSYGVIISVGTFEEIEIGMKCILSSESIGGMKEGNVVSKDEEMFEVQSLDGYSAYGYSSETPMLFPDLTN